MVTRQTQDSIQQERMNQPPRHRHKDRANPTHKQRRKNDSMTRLKAVTGRQHDEDNKNLTMETASRTQSMVVKKRLLLRFNCCFGASIFDLLRQRQTGLGWVVALPVDSTRFIVVDSNSSVQKESQRHRSVHSRVAEPG